MIAETCVETIFKNQVFKNHVSRKFETFVKASSGSLEQVLRRGFGYNWVKCLAFT